jgi:hypothetical protein
VPGAVFEVSNTLGAGFLEKVYERALLMELRLRGIKATAQTSIAVTYSAERLGNEHTAQCLNYLRASNLNVCLLVNFQKSKVEWRRIVHAF